MKLVTYNALAIGAAALTLNVPVASSIDEFDKLSGRDGAALDSANNNEVYRGVLADFRYYFCEELQKQLKTEYPQHPELARQLKKKEKDDDADAYSEPELKYFRRVLATLASIKGVPEILPTVYQPLADYVMSLNETDADGKDVLFDDVDENGNPVKVTKKLIRFDPSRSERAERGPKQLPKVYIKAAETIFGQGNADAFIKHYQLTPVIPEDKVDDETVVKAAKIDVIARKIKALEDAERAKEDLSAKYAIPAAA